MSISAIERLNSDKPFIAAQGTLMCVVEGSASPEETTAILRLSKFNDPSFRVAGRTIHEWIVAAMDVLNIRKCTEPADSACYELIQMMQDPDWKTDMREILWK